MCVYIYIYIYHLQEGADIDIQNSLGATAFNVLVKYKRTVFFLLYGHDVSREDQSIRDIMENNPIFKD
jgi:hypothetical protein